MPETEEGKNWCRRTKVQSFSGMCRLIWDPCTKPWPFCLYFCICLPKFKIPHKYVMYDKFHRGAVLCLISASVIIFVRICVDLRHYYKVRSPILHEIARLDKETKMEEMQKEREEAFKLQKTLQEEANKV